MSLILQLSHHWITSVLCNHLSATDQALCSCGWRSPECPNVGLAVIAWAEHVTGTFWIPVTERLPDTGDWRFDDEVAPADGTRESAHVPVIVDGEITWAVFWQETDDHGRTVFRSGWDKNHDCESCEPTHWFQLPNL
jgi:hypothetical protein